MRQAAVVSLPERHSRVDALAAHVRIPLYRDGYALVLNSGITALLGVVYWLLAARDYSPRVVGVNTAAISAMMFLAGVAQLNLMSSLVRFVPILGSARARFIAACYLVAAVAAVGCGAVFLLGVHVWTPALGVLHSSNGMTAWFVGACVAWCVFNLQDNALTGLGAAIFVPAENFVYGVAKIILLVALVPVSPHFGIFGSWTAALLISLVPVNVLIFGPLLRRRAHTRASAIAPPTRQEIVRFVAPDYVGALLWMSATTLMPVIVIAVAGATENAFFSLAWMITMPLIAISTGTTTALVATAASDPARIAEYARKVLWQTARLVIPVALTVAVAAPYLLRLFGQQYAVHAASTLSLLALSAIPNMITALHVSIYRVQRRMRAVVALLAALCGSVLVLAPLLIGLIGISGVGLAWLVSQTATAAALLVIDRRSLRPNLDGALDLIADLGAVAVLRSLRAHRFGRRNVAQLSQCVPPGMTLTAVEPTINDVVVGRAGAPDQPTAVMVKLACSVSGASCLHRGTAGLEALRADPRLGGWNVPRPDIIMAGELQGRSYVIESELAGVSIAHLIKRGAPWQPLVSVAQEAIAGLHRCTAEVLEVDSGVVDRWITAPALALEPVVAGVRRRAVALHDLRLELASRLEGQTLTAAWIHGDFVPSNVLIDPRANKISGIVDWDLTARSDLPALDYAMFVLAVHSQVARRELGGLIAALARGEAGGALRDSLDQALAGPHWQPLDTRSLALLCWLRHVAALVSKSERYARHPLWKRYNVYRVIDSLGGR